MSWQDTSIYDTTKRLFVGLVGLCLLTQKTPRLIKVER